MMAWKRTGGRVDGALPGDEDVPRSSLRGLLRHLRGLGFRPATIIDVGVDRGTPELYDTFADARYVLVEPLPERAADLDRLARELGGAVVVRAAAARTPGRLTLHVHHDRAGSSLYREAEGPLADGTPCEVDAVTLDAVCAEHRTKGPYLIKLDTQGSELDALAGAGRVLAETEVVVLEASLFGFYVGGVQLAEVVAWMKEKGFVVYDVFGPLHRPLDGALAQLDLAFVREAGRFRVSHRFLSVEGREAHVRRLTEGFAGRWRRRMRRLLGLGRGRARSTGSG